MSKRNATVTTRVSGWAQRSLFNSYELAPYKKNRYRDIRARLAREKKARETQR